jgi:NACalpha-BTF3-like transcription factor
MLGMRPKASETGPSGPGRGRWVPAVVVVAAGAVILLLVNGTLIDLPDWFDGGRSDPAPRGSVTYKGQEARAASERFLVDIGDGEAVVEIEAKQNWDRHGWIIDGDFQSTNGTSSVADPDDRDLPARLRVAVDYCADGTMTTTTAADGGEVLALTFEMGSLYVCDTTLEHTTENDAAFRQDDTPADFHGEFVSFVARAAETTAAASACPTEELERFRTGEYRRYVERQLADRHGVAADDVEVTVGRVGASDEDTRAALETALGRVAERQDPDDPDVSYEALSIQYLAGDGEAVADSCYLDPGARDLDEIAAGPASSGG